MIIAHLRHGLGNQLFQYAAARHLSLARDVPLGLDTSFYAAPQLAAPPRRYWLDWFSISAERLLVFRTAKGVAVKVPPGTIPYREPRGGFDTRFAELSGSALWLRGFFQSERYFKPSAPTIRQELRVARLPKLDWARRIANDIRSSSSVAIHVRRTDYVGNPRYDLLTPAYFRATVQHVRAHVEAARFFVFSDDIAYCRANLGLDATYVGGDERGHPIMDLRLMTLCKHQIISNSSFSWWGAWLNDNPSKIVVAPSIWVRPAEDRPIDETLPAEWVRLAPA